MFDSTPFSHSWPAIVAGAAVFGLLFGFVGALSDLLFTGELRATRFAVGFGVCAFVGYLGVVALLKHDDRR